MREQGRTKNAGPNKKFKARPNYVVPGLGRSQGMCLLGLFNMSSTA